MVDLSLFWMILGQIPDNWTFRLGLLFTGIVCAVYLGWYRYLTVRWRERVNREREAIKKLKDCIDKKNAPWSGSSRRENSMILMGSIFVVAAFTILAGAVAGNTTGQGIAIAAPLVYSIWLLTIQLSTRVMNDSDAAMRLIAEGEDGTAGILRRLYGDGHGTTWLIRFRRNHWLAYVPTLWFSAIYLIMR